MKKLLKLSLLISLLLVFVLTLIPNANACTRVVYKGPNGTIITARSMDWKDKIPANLWVFPRGIQRNGETGSNSLMWTSKYGSIIASSWDFAVTNGMNEKGLVANALWLEESKYPVFDTNGNQKGLTIAAWAQYALDNFATVDEAVTELRKEEFVIVSEYIPGTDRFTALHLALSDASGDNAIFEYVEGKLVIHHGPEYQVMTNSPTYDQQLAINTYWEGIPGTIMLPGTTRAADRFVRATYYIHAIPQTDNTRVAVASVLSVIRNVSVPFGISSKDEPNISSTRWRSVADHKNLVYYFETALTPNTFWVDMKNIDFSENTPSKKLIVNDEITYNGDASDSFIDAAPFKFAGL